MQLLLDAGTRVDAKNETRHQLCIGWPTRDGAIR